MTTPSPGMPSSRTQLLVAGSLVAAVLLFAVGFTWLLTSATDDPPASATAAPSSTTTTSTDPSGGVTPPPTGPSSPSPDTVPDPAEIQGVVIPELLQFVEQQRGHEFERDVEVVLLDDPDFEQRVAGTLPPGYIDQLLWLYAALGFVEANDEAAALLTDLFVTGLAGYYDPETQQVYVRGSERSTETDQTIVHELTHALDDQVFGISRPELEELPDESPFGFESLVEGDARVVENSYAEMMGSLPSAGIPTPPPGLPPVVAELALPSYDLGEWFVLSLIDAGGMALVDEAFSDPARTSKEIIEPDRYLDGFVPTPVDPPPADGRVVDEGLFGQLLFSQLFAVVLPDGEADALAKSWMGDWQVVWTEGDVQCLRVDVTTDTRGSSAAFADVLEEWAAEQDDAQVETLPSGLVRMTTCAPLPPAGSEPGPA